MVTIMHITTLAPTSPTVLCGKVIDPVTGEVLQAYDKHTKEFYPSLCIVNSLAELKELHEQNVNQMYVLGTLNDKGIKAKKKGKPIRRKKNGVEACIKAHYDQLRVDDWDGLELPHAHLPVEQRIREFYDSYGITCDLYVSFSASQKPNFSIINAHIYSMYDVPRALWERQAHGALLPGNDVCVYTGVQPVYEVIFFDNDQPDPILNRRILIPGDSPTQHMPDEGDLIGSLAEQGKTLERERTADGSTVVRGITYTSRQAAEADIINNVNYHFAIRYLAISLHREDLADELIVMTLKDTLERAKHPRKSTHHQRAANSYLKMMVADTGEWCKANPTSFRPKLDFPTDITPFGSLEKFSTIDITPDIVPDEIYKVALIAQKYLNCPINVGVMVQYFGLGSLLGNKLRIDHQYQLYICINVIIAMPTSYRKTALLKLLLGPIFRYMEKRTSSFHLNKAAAQAELVMYKSMVSRLKTKIGEDGVTDKGTPSRNGKELLKTLTFALNKIEELEAPEPIYSIKDFTAARLDDILSKHCAHLNVVSDEARALLVALLKDIRDSNQLVTLLNMLCNGDVGTDNKSLRMGVEGKGADRGWKEGVVCLLLIAQDDVLSEFIKCDASASSGFLPRTRFIHGRLANGLTGHESTSNAPTDSEISAIEQMYAPFINFYDQHHAPGRGVDPYVVEADAAIRELKTHYTNVEIPELIKQYPDTDIGKTNSQIDMYAVVNGIVRNGLHKDGVYLSDGNSNVDYDAYEMARKLNVRLIEMSVNDEQTVHVRGCKKPALVRLRAICKNLSPEKGKANFTTNDLNQCIDSRPEERQKTPGVLELLVEHGWLRSYEGRWFLREDWQAKLKVHYPQDWQKVVGV